MGQARPGHEGSKYEAQTSPVELTHLSASSIIKSIHFIQIQFVMVAFIELELCSSSMNTKKFEYNFLSS